MMTQEHKQLLLKDLCARLRYGVKVCARFNTGSRYTTNVTAICTDRDYIETRQNVLHPYRGSSAEDIRPYLRPMSSMTEEEEYIYLKLRAHALPFAIVEWLDKNHFDHRTNKDGETLIEMDLALEAPEGMYKTK